MSAATKHVGEETASQEDADLMSGNISLFKTICNDAGVKHKIHINITAALNKLLDESAFADLILIDSRANFNYDVSEQLNASLRYLFVDAHCPVLAISETAKPPEKIIIAYDGSDSCIFAIKAFSYIFPEWKHMKVFIVTVNIHAVKHLHTEESIKDWIELHFENCEFIFLEGDLKNTFIQFVITNQENAIVVMGAYGRNAISRMFRQSLADVVLKQSTASVFLTHI